MATESASSPSPFGPAVFCSSCGSGLRAGARFGHRCGAPSADDTVQATAMSAPPQRGLAAVLPWGVAFVSLMALVAMIAGRNFGVPKGSRIDGSANALPTPAIDGPAMMGGAATGDAPPGSGPRSVDISSMTPEVRADRLYERVMTYDERGFRDSVGIFAPMALAAHEMLPSIDIDRRYHAGRIAEAAGLADMALAHADTMLAGDANHLLGLILGARAARLGNDSAKARAFDQRLLRVLDAQRARQLPEYEQHAREIELEVGIARGATP